LKVQKRPSCIVLIVLALLVRRSVTDSHLAAALLHISLYCNCIILQRLQCWRDRILF